MNQQASIEQVAGILARHDYVFGTHPDGDRYRLPFGEDAVFVNFGTWRDRIVITVSSPVLQIDPEGPAGAVVLNELNELNRLGPFVKFMLADETLVAACDVLGEALQASELINAIDSVAAAADHAAAKLQPQTGGRRHADVMAQHAVHADDNEAPEA